MEKVEFHIKDKWDGKRYLYIIKQEEKGKEKQTTKN